MSTEELRSLRSLLYVGNYGKLLQEAQQLQGADHKTAVQRDVYVHRALIAQGKHAAVFKAVDKAAAVPLQAVKLLATYLTSQADQKDLVFDTLSEWLSDASMAEDSTVQLMAAQIYFEAEDYKQALKLVVDKENLEAYVPVCLSHGTSEVSRVLESVQQSALRSSLLED